MDREKLSGRLESILRLMRSAENALTVRWPLANVRAFDRLTAKDRFYARC